MTSVQFARYELIRKIAAGGQAEVFLARQWGQADFFNDLVIKRLFRHLADDPRTLRLFQDEARLMAELSHPSVPQVFELGLADGHWYMAMEYVPGFTLGELQVAGTRAAQPMPLGVALGIAIQLCEGLHHGHERRDHASVPMRIVHRDVSPDNVMVTPDGVVKILDFGVAQSSGRTTPDLGTVGTYAYMAPEQVRGLPLDKRADVFAIGVLLYELTTGCRAFTGSDVQVMTAIVERDPPPPSQLRADYPSDVEATVLAALARNRQQRTSSAGQLALQLEQLAIRHSLLTGPRVVARHVRRMFPYEPVADRSVGFVSSAPWTDPRLRG
ncbi:MAG: serine/threonine protein kinase [Proteobacteria bacterium]|nr:serine/threonine protein kinase [Pseudomonadota bacterium]